MALTKIQLLKLMSVIWVKYENMHAYKKVTESQKTVIIGIVERNSRQVKAMKVPSSEKDFLLPKINLLTASMPK